MQIFMSSSKQSVRNKKKTKKRIIRFQERNLKECREALLISPKIHIHPHQTELSHQIKRKKKAKNSLLLILKLFFFQLC